MKFNATQTQASLHDFPVRVGRLAAHVGAASAKASSASRLLTQAALTIDGHPVEPKPGVDQAQAERLGNWLVGASILAPVAVGALAFGLPGALLLGAANLVAANIPGQVSVFALAGAVALIAKGLSLASKAVDVASGFASKLVGRRADSASPAPVSQPLAKAAP